MLEDDPVAAIALSKKLHLTAPACLKCAPGNQHNGAVHRSESCMTVKQTIVAEFGDAKILSPDAIARSLEANDQIKYYFALLQSARDNADHPRVPVADLKAERIACQLKDVWLDDVVAATRKTLTGAYLVPRGHEILRRIEAAVEMMLACLPDTEREQLSMRAESLDLRPPADGSVPGSLIAAMTSGDRKAGDSLHLVVMDAHRAINRLQAETAVEDVAGARVHHLSESGRRRVEAFMRGLNRTAPLKFDHPGLGTTATEYEGRLLIQNDIGTTDAHVLVVRVDSSSATITYTDIHAARLQFFKSLLQQRGLEWETTEERRSDKIASGQYMLATGHFAAQDEADLLRYLEHLGSRIVFLIDWNKMRKRLRGFVGKEEAVAVLKWAADNDYGHRALLEVGGERALAEAVEYAAGSHLRYGQRLDDLISSRRAVEFLKEAFRLASTGLRQRRSRRNIKDEIKANLRSLFEHERLGIFDIAADHGAIGYDLARAIVDALSRVIGGVHDPGRFAGLCTKAAEWERRADQLLNDARDDIARFGRPRHLLLFIERCDDAIDELEEAAALLELVHMVEAAPEAITRLQALAELALLSAQEIVKTVECAANITRSDVRDDLDEFMQALEELMSIEHKADEVLRGVRRWLIESHAEPRQIIVLRDLAAALESATDAHVHSGQALRAYLMDEVLH